MDERKGERPQRNTERKRDIRRERPKMSRREYERRKQARLRKLKIRRAIVLGVMAVVVILLILLVTAGVKALIPDKKKTTASETKTTETEKKEVKPVTLTLSFAGDCTLGTDENFDETDSLPSVYDEKGADYFFQNVKSIFEADDLTVANLEGTFTTATERAEKTYAFKADPSYSAILTSGSVEAVNLANNHSHDYGNQGFEDTQKAVKDAGITSFGYEDTQVIEVKGVKVGLIGISQVSATEEDCLKLLKEDMTKVKKAGAQMIVVSFHWGVEKEPKPEQTQVNLAHAAIDEGATLVIGHHPHVLQGIEKYKGRYIAYSLGNFCFGGNTNPSETDTMIFQQTFTVTGDKVAEDDQYQTIPCSVSSSSDINNYQPTPLDGEEKNRVLTKIQERSEGLTTEASADGGDTDSKSTDSTSTDSGSTDTDTKKSESNTEA